MIEQGLSLSISRLKNILSFAEKLAEVFDSPNLRLRLEEDKTHIIVPYRSLSGIPKYEQDRMKKFVEVLAAHLIGKIELSDEQKKMSAEILMAEFLEGKLKPKTAEPVIKQVTIDHANVVIVSEI